MWPISIAAATALSRAERRESPRQIVGEEAELFIPCEEMKLPCIVVNMSVGGAKVTCDVIPPTGTPVVLFLKGGLSITAVTAWYSDDTLGLKFAVPGDE